MLHVILMVFAFIISLDGYSSCSLITIDLVVHLNFEFTGLQKNMCALSLLHLNVSLKCLTICFMDYIILYKQGSVRKINGNLSQRIGDFDVNHFSLVDFFLRLLYLGSLKTIPCVHDLIYLRITCLENIILCEE